MISTQGNLKILASLCISRPPLKFVEPSHLVEARKEQRRLEEVNKTGPVIDDELVYMRLPTHFLPGKEELERMEAGLAPTAASTRKSIADSDSQQSSAQESLIAQIQGGNKPTVSTPHRENILKSKRSSKLADFKVGNDANLTDHLRKPGDFLHLIVKYKDAPETWTLPWGHRRGDDSMETTLLRVSQQQLGLNPYVLNFCPVGFRQIAGDPFGAKLFYYRSMVNPREMKLEGNGDVEDFAWATREELGEKLPLASWSVVRRFLPLSDC